jgi:hypothetical protein
MSSKDFKIKNNLDVQGGSINLSDKTISADEDGIKVPSIKIGTGGNEISLSASASGKLIQTAKVGGVAQSPVSYTIEGLDNTTITTPTVGQVLSYDTTNTKWVNTSPVDAYTKGEVDTALTNKASSTHTHDYAPTVHTHDLSAYDTSSEVDAKIIANAGSSVVVSDTVPTNPSAGDLWTDSTNMRMFVYYVDSDSSQWVEVGSAITNNVLRTTLVKSGDLNIFTGTEKWYSVDSITFLDYNLFLGTAPVGNNLTVVINKNGVAVQTLVVPSTQTSVTGISSFTMVPSDYITIDITSIGTDTTGSDLTLILTYSVI